LRDFTKSTWNNMSDATIANNIRPNWKKIQAQDCTCLNAINVEPRDQLLLSRPVFMQSKRVKERRLENDDQYYSIFFMLN